MQQTLINEKNGVNVDQLVGTIDAVKINPDIAKFEFRSHTDWVKGGHCITRIKDFYGALQEDASRKEALVIEGDEPSVLLGSNKAPNAVEAVLHALASCLSVGLVYNAAARDIDIKCLKLELCGQLDLHKFLGLSQKKRAGFECINAEIEIESNTDTREIRDLLSYVVDTSPVMDILLNPVPVRVNLK